MSKQEADRLADALESEFTRGRISNQSGREAAALLRQWPDGEPVCKLTECQGRPRCQMCRAMDARYTAPPDAAARIAELEAQRDALRRLIADDAHAMTFQTLGQYRSALLKAAGGGK